MILQKILIERSKLVNNNENVSLWYFAFDTNEAQENKRQSFYQFYPAPLSIKND